MTHTVASESEDIELGFSTCLNSEPQKEIHGGAVNLSESHKKWVPVKSCPFGGLLKTKGRPGQFGDLCSLTFLMEIELYKTV